jgi:hypothetical protein
MRNTLQKIQPIFCGISPVFRSISQFRAKPDIANSATLKADGFYSNPTRRAMSLPVTFDCTMRRLNRGELLFDAIP